MPNMSTKKKRLAALEKELFVLRVVVVVWLKRTACICVAYVCILLPTAVVRDSL